MEAQEQARARIAKLADIFSQAAGLKLTTVLSRATNDARFLDRTRDGAKTFTFRLYETAIRWFSDHWPDSAEWPSDVPRPAPASAPEPTGAAS